MGEEMRMERLVILPFSVGCVSESSVAVAVPRRSPPSSSSSSSSSCTSTNPSAPNYCINTHYHPHSQTTLRPVRGGYRLLHLQDSRSPTLVPQPAAGPPPQQQHPAPPPPISMKYSLNHISSGIHRLFKTFSHIFAYKLESEEDEAADEEDMEIGFPTDVKHVAHIGIGLEASSSSCSSSSSASISIPNSNITNDHSPGGCIIAQRLINGACSLDQYHHLITMQAPPTATSASASATSSSYHLLKPID